MALTMNLNLFRTDDAVNYIVIRFATSMMPYKTMA